jgi:hypothetical protein
MNKANDRVTKEDRILRVRHAVQLHEEDFHKEIAQDEVTERIAINLGGESDDSK